MPDYILHYYLLARTRFGIGVEPAAAGSMPVLLLLTGGLLLVLLAVLRAGRRDRAIVPLDAPGALGTSRLR